ncbi:MAG: DoxX family protein [Acidobacteriota bacterium]
MTRWLAPYQDHAYALLRIVAGLLFACHGAQKLFGLFGAQGPMTAPLMLTAGVVEFFGGLAIALGLRVSVAAFIASGEMAVAYFMVHARRALLPIQNGGELAVVYAFLYLFMATRGSGAWSLDRLLGFRGEEPKSA